MRSRKNQRRRNQSQARKSAAGGKNRYSRPDAPGGFTVRLGQLQQGADAAANPITVHVHHANFLQHVLPFMRPASLSRILDVGPTRTSFPRRRSGSRWRQPYRDLVRAGHVRSGSRVNKFDEFYQNLLKFDGFGLH
jgi:hypothetical protein